MAARIYRGRALAATGDDGQRAPNRRLGAEMLAPSSGALYRVAPRLLEDVAMMDHRPSIVALESHDDLLVSMGRRLAGLRSQAAVVRALANQLTHFPRAADAAGLRNQLIEEVARLARRIAEAAVDALPPGASGGSEASRDTGALSPVP